MSHPRRSLHYHYGWYITSKDYFLEVPSYFWGYRPAGHISVYKHLVTLWTINIPSLTCNKSNLFFLLSVQSTYMRPAKFLHSNWVWRADIFSFLSLWASLSMHDDRICSFLVKYVLIIIIYFNYYKNIYNDYILLL